MKRREVLQRGVLLGTALAADPAVGPRPAPADNLPVFFEGALRGRDFPNWTLFLNLTGTRVQGRADGPVILEGTPEVIRGLRMQGRLQNGRLRMDLYAIEDLNLTRPIGALDGLVNQYGLLKGALQLPDRG